MADQESSVQAARVYAVGRPTRSNAQLRDAAKARILTTAIRLIAQRGAAKLTLVDIAREANFSHSLPNYYFRNKTLLLLEVHRFISVTSRSRAKAWLARNTAARAQPGLESIESTIRAYLGLALDDAIPTRAMNVLWSESVSSTPVLLAAVRDSNRIYLDRFESHIRAGIRRGEMDPQTDAASLAVLILALLRGLASQQLLEPNAVDLQRLAQTAIAFVRQATAPSRKLE
jgi:AcrR family transcriptional regulator